MALLKDRIAVVTGASRGIGYAVAKALAAQGAHIVALARPRSVGALEELDDDIRAMGGSVTLTPLDLTDYEGIDRLGAALYERWGKLDILVGNAGLLGSLSPLGHLAPKEWDEVMAVNVTANWRLIRSLIRFCGNRMPGAPCLSHQGPRTRLCLIGGFMPQPRPPWKKWLKSMPQNVPKRRSGSI
ncbi:hypothetical protein JCM17846_06020 [Iodidimonas nitroreducens]|uniref:Uncharacterized protein n=1 Tax=Iodidimonas nitroreducens TaxID=1236968 RepID=A0A5A7N679_9PROT|nr:hypothetical protein JCM17846_06020 [Iodidimonas nitroreducens]